MSFFQEDGVLTSRTDAGTDVVPLTGSGASLDVKLVMLTMNGATSAGGANANFMLARGVSDGTDERCSFTLSEDGAETTNASRSSDDTSILSIYDTSDALIDQATISSIGNGTFTVNWTTKSGNAYYIGWTAWGGDELEVEVGTFPSSTSTGAQNVSTTLKSADAGIYIGSATTTATINTAVNTGLLSVGFADSSLNQGVSGIWLTNGAETSSEYRAQETDRWILHPNAGGTFLEAELTGFDAVNGIQLDWKVVNVTARDCFYVLLKGGRWEVGSGTTNTSATTKSYTTSFQPVGVQTAMISNIVTSSTVTHARLVLGGTDGTGTHAHGATSNTGIGTTECGTSTSGVDVLRSIAGANTSSSPTIDGRGQPSSFNITDFTFDWSVDADTTEKEFVFMVCAPNASTETFFQEDGVLTSRTDAGTDRVQLSKTGSTLDVKLVRLTLNGATATGTADADFLMAGGVSNGTDERCIFGLSEDNVGITNVTNANHADSVISVYDTSDTLIDQATISVIGNGTFTINWTTKSSTAYLVKWTTWGGSDITAIEIGSFESPATATTQNINTTIKSADMAMFLGGGNTPANENTATNGCVLGLGFGDSAINQGTISIDMSNGIETSETNRFTASDSCIATIFGGSVFEEADLTALDAVNGIQLNWSTANATARDYYYVLIKGGQWEVGSGTTNTSATTKSYPTSFQPVGLTVMNTVSSSLGSVQGTAAIDLGSTDGTSQSAMSASDGSGVETTECGTTTHTSYTLTTADGSSPPTVLGLAKFDSFNALNFTLNWEDDADAANYDFVWMVCAAEGGLLRHSGMMGGMDDLLGGLRA